jgi:hypothetical protein
MVTHAALRNLQRAYERVQQSRVEVWRVVIEPLTETNNQDTTEIEGMKVTVVDRIYRGAVYERNR